MSLKNTENEYGCVAKGFHWVIALLILGLIPLGLYMGGLMPPFKYEVYDYHKSFGILVLLLAILRVVWRLLSPAPAHLPTHKPWEVMLAKGTHVLLYLGMIGIPLSGWMMSSAGGHPVALFGLELPALVSKGASIGKVAKEMHEILPFVLLGILALHVAGALKHKVVDKDTTMARMAGSGKRGMVMGILAVSVFAASYLAVGVLALNGEDEEKPPVETPAAAQAVPMTTPADATAPAPSMDKDADND